jgi:excisionase family DNA binding protein
MNLELPDSMLDEIARRAAELVTAQAVTAVTTSPWLDTKGAADYLAASPGRIHDLVQLGRITPRRDGRRLLFRREELDSYVENSR